MSSVVNIKRGCRQGDPIAPYIFILCVEILGIRFRNNNRIKGIEVNNCPVLISQYADDTTLILDGSEISLKESIVELNKFAKISGLKLNIDKTQVIWIGSKIYCSDTFLPELNLQWGRDKFTLLGIDFSVNLHEIPKINFDKKLVKLKTLIKTWSRRSLTPIGKIVLIKSLLLSQLNHLFISIPNPDEQFLQSISSIFYSFIWNSKVDKIKRDIMTQSYHEGGLKMVNIKVFIDSLKLSWIRRLIQKQCKWQLVFNSLFDLQKLSTCGSGYIQECLKNCKNKFWKDVFKAWVRLNDSEGVKNMQNKFILRMPLWHNRNFTIGKKSVFYKDWYNKGVTIVNDLVKDHNTLLFYTFQEFTELLSVNTNFLQYQGLISSVKVYLQKSNIEFDKQLVVYPLIPNNIAIFLNRGRGCKDFYNLMIKKNHYSYW